MYAAEARCSRKGNPTFSRGRQPRHQMKRLEHHANPLTPKSRPIGVGKAASQLTVETNVAGGRAIKAGKQIEQRAFSASAWAHDHATVAGADLKAYAPQGGHRDVPATVVFADAIQYHHGNEAFFQPETGRVSL